VGVLIRRTQASQRIQGGAACLAVAWLVVQAASIGFPAFDAITYHDTITTALLEDNPRYQALMKKVEARIEKL
jgi:hypothetical protein